jgi:hypothetical protein
MTEDVQDSDNTVRRFNFPPRFFCAESINCNEPIVFHYTTAAGALGILSSGEMWCTSAAHLNDASDCRHIYEVATNIAAQRLLRLGQSSFQAAVLGEMRDQFERCSVARVYVASFSEVGDLLSQWRGYSQGAGYCLGFSLNSLTEVANKQGFSVADVKYTLEDQEALVSPIVDRFLKKIDPSAEFPADRQKLESLFGPFVQELILLSPLIKHVSFAEEREWRVFSKPLMSYDHCLSFTARENRIIPHASMTLFREKIGELSDMCFRTCRVGPGPDQPERQRVMMQVIHHFRVHWRFGTISLAPLR